MLALIWVRLPPRLIEIGYMIGFVTQRDISDTMMAQFRFSDSDIRGVVEFVMRDTQFIPESRRG